MLVVMCENILKERTSSDDVVPVAGCSFLDVDGLVLSLWTNSSSCFVSR